MKKAIITLLALVSLSVPVGAISGTASAANVFQACSSSSGADTTDVCRDANSQHGNTGKNNPIVKIINKTINILSFVIGIAAVIGIVVSGVRIMLAAGDSQAVASARTGLIYSLAGLAVAAVAKAIVAFVLGKVG